MAEKEKGGKGISIANGIKLNLSGRRYDVKTEKGKPLEPIKRLIRLFGKPQKGD